MSATELVYNTKLPRSVLKKLPRLLPTFYSLEDLMEELGATREELEPLFKWGAPHRVDCEGEIWVTGEDFAYWVEALERFKNCELVDDLYAFCEKCNKLVSMEEPQTTLLRAKYAITNGKCGLCGEIVKKAIQIG